MFKKIRPLIFKFSPEVAHSLAIKTLKSNLIPSSKAIDSEILKTKLFGKNIKNPIGVAAGFDKNAEVYNPLFNLGFGFLYIFFSFITSLKYLIASRRIVGCYS